jgi:antitoxin component of MazEF toxin-antitoxin module
LEAVKMQTTIVKWGNNQGIRIPKTFLKDIHVSENDPVDIMVSDEKIIIKKVKSINHKTTKERLAEFCGTNFNQKGAGQTETDWGRAVRKEERYFA